MLLAETKKQPGFISSLLQIPAVNVSKSLKMDRNRNIVVHKGAKVSLGKNAKVMNDGHLSLGEKHDRKNNADSLLNLADGASLFVRGSFAVSPGFKISVACDALLQLGSGEIKPHVNIVCTEKVIIGDGANIGPYVTIRDCDENKANLSGEIQCKPVTIGDNVTIGMKATILKGVTIGDGATVEAGSVVTMDVPAGCTVAGVPAKLVDGHSEWH